MKMAATTARPAQRSPRALRRRNAIPSGMAISASPALWMRSASSATLPESTNTTACSAAVSARMRQRHGSNALARPLDALIDEAVRMAVTGVVMVMLVALLAVNMRPVNGVFVLKALAVALTLTAQGL